MATGGRMERSEHRRANTRKTKGPILLVPSSWSDDDDDAPFRTDPDILSTAMPQFPTDHTTSAASSWNRTKDRKEDISVKNEEKS